MFGPLPLAEPVAEPSLGPSQPSDVASDAKEPGSVLCLVVGARFKRRGYGL